jgi:outer membrane protein assembly factor BamB
MVLALVGLPAGSTSAEDWAQFRGPGGHGRSAASGPVAWSHDENIVWKAELPGAGASTPIVVGNRIFLTSYSGYAVPKEDAGDLDKLVRRLLCVDLKTGKLLWDKQVAARQPEPDRIRDHGYAANSVVADSQRVFAFFGKSGVFAFDHNGRQVWQADVGDGTNGWGTAASPVLFGNLVIVNASVESQSLVALDQKTGKQVWRARGIKESWSTPLLVPVGGKTELVVPMFEKILGFDPGTGEQLWSCDTEIRWYMVPSLVAHDGVVYCVGGRSGGALAVRAGGRGDVTDSHRLWTGRKGSNVSSPVYHDEHLYWAHEQTGVVYCAEAKSGDIVYEQRLERAGQIYASALLADDKVYYLTRDGRTFVVAAKPDYELIGVNELRDGFTFNASPVLAGDRLLVRSDRFLYCIGR